MNDIKKQDKAMNDHFDFSSDQFSFTRSEVAFVKKYLQIKYPSVMGEFINAARDLMTSVQTNVDKKLQYQARLIYNPEGTRYTVSEVLYSPPVSKQYASVFSIESVTLEKRRKLNPVGQVNPEQLAHIMTVLDTIKVGQSTFSNTKMKHGGIDFKIICEYILKFLEVIRKKAVIHTFDISTENNTTRLILEVGHRNIQTHILLIDVELDWPMEM